jgi:ketosteroid isomerase-like protein
MDTVLTAIHAFERGDIDGLLDLCAPEIEITQPPEIPGAPRHLSGHEGVLESFAIWTEQWDDFGFEILHSEESGDWVVVTMLNRGRGRESGIAVEAKFVHAFRAADGLIREWQIFIREDQVRKAIGLEE